MEISNGKRGKHLRSRPLRNLFAFCPNIEIKENICPPATLFNEASLTSTTNTSVTIQNQVMESEVCIRKIPETKIPDLGPKIAL